MRSHILSLMFLCACVANEHAGSDRGSESVDPTTGPPTEPTGSSDPDSTGSTSDTSSSGPGDIASTITGDSADPGEPPPPTCGDGIVDPGEMCDEGDALNIETGACLPNCVLATCGDGLVHAGVEQCDFGPNNSNLYGGCVPGTCYWGPQCGDGVVTPTHELCDPGAPVDAETIPCDLDCRFDGKIVFLSSEVYSGALNELSGADLKCQNLARTFDPERFHTYRAWLSDASSDPASTFTHATVPYVQLNGVAIAASWDDLVQSGPDVGITITDTFQSRTGARVWTHTGHTGVKLTVDHHCQQWTSDSINDLAMVGLNSVDVGSPDQDTWATERWWTRYQQYNCKTPRSLYCFEN